MCGNRRTNVRLAATRVRHLLAAAGALALAACAATSPPPLSSGHLRAAPDDIPAPVLQAPVLPPPAAAATEELYTVVVSNVEVKDLLFALARDAGRNIDVHPAIKGRVTLNAVQQPMSRILERIAEQVAIRYQLLEAGMIIRPDTPYLDSYRVDYVNMARESRSTMSVATEIATAGGTVSGATGNNNTAGQAGNNSRTTVSNISDAKFWDSLVNSIQAIVTDRDAGGKIKDAADDVIANPMSGIITVRATARQHRMIGELITKVQNNAHRQVLIEASIVEVELSDRYQSGVDWQRLAQSGTVTGDGGSVVSSMLGGSLQTAPFLFLGYNHTAGNNSNISAAVRMLESFGDVKVLSSPKIMALNNQTAVLKVVDEKVYFTVDREETFNADGSARGNTYTSEIHTVPVGLVMSVTPQITEDAVVTMNVRPTISRITGYVVDPAPRLASQNASGSGYDNLIPEIQVREMESLLKVNNGNMVVLGGLMQNKVGKAKSGVPFLASLPLIGHLFSYRDEESRKTELVIFLRPTVVDGDSQANLADIQQYLPAARPAR